MQRVFYYFGSIFTMLRHIKNWFVIPLLLISSKLLIIELRNGCKFRVRSLMDVWIIKETCLDRDYELNGTSIQSHWVVVDIGAGIGEFSILTAREQPDSQIYAYEPFAESFSLLQDNLELNHIKNVEAFPVAVGATSGQMMLATTGEAVQHTTTDSTLAGVPTSQIEVQGISLDELFISNNIPYCHFLKIDCEGCEFEILFSASDETLSKVEHICLEYHDGFTEYSHPALVAYLEQKGFSVQTTINPVHDYLGFIYAHRI